MGVKDLWNLLTPYMERKPLFELSNKVVAIDLSGWVCESLNVVDYFVHPRFYLRNLFFRTCYLLQTGITPVFVLEGAVPPLKYGVIVKRNQTQFRGARPKKVNNCDKSGNGSSASRPADKQGQPSEQKRNRFHQVLKQCEELLSAMGLVCVQAPGEAEALCAYLNHDGHIYGVISQDSDCFAYGAVRVFRNFCASQTGGGSVDVYDLQRLDGSALKLGQEKIIAMALLTGCDYCPAGVLGVGREMVARFLSCCQNDSILAKIRSWRRTTDRLTELEVKVDDKNICSDCGHAGKLQQHRKSGCLDCQRSAGCDESRWKQQRANIKAELEIKRKALKDPNFPHEPIIEEFLTRPCELPTLDLSWKQPNLVKFTQSMSSYLQWNELYCFQKLLPLFTRWQIDSASVQNPKRSNVFLTPDYIKKKRAPKGIASYEIVWKDAHGLFRGLIPQEQIDAYLEEAGNTLENLWSTIEPHELVLIAYPELLDAFLLSKVKGKRKKVAKPSQTQTEKEKPKKKVTRKKKDEKQQRLSAFLKNPDTGSKEQDKATVQNDEENQVNLLNRSPPYMEDNVNLNLTAELEAIAEDRTANDTFNSSDVIDRLCRPNYLQRALVEYMELIETEKKSAALHELLSQSLALLPTDEDEDTPVQHRIVLKQNILNASLSSAHPEQTLPVARKTKRKSFFFEPIQVPPDGGDDGSMNPEMDMFECSLMLKDQIIIDQPVYDGEGLANQTIVYDIDF